MSDIKFNSSQEETNIFVDPCEKDIYVYDAVGNFVVIPKDGTGNYYDGVDWKQILCCSCEKGKIINNITKFPQYISHSFVEGSSLFVIGNMSSTDGFILHVNTNLDSVAAYKEYVNMQFYHGVIDATSGNLIVAGTSGDNIKSLLLGITPATLDIAVELIVSDYTAGTTSSDDSRERFNLIMPSDFTDIGGSTIKYVVRGLIHDRQPDSTSTQDEVILTSLDSTLTLKNSKAFSYSGAVAPDLEIQCSIWELDYVILVGFRLKNLHVPTIIFIAQTTLEPALTYELTQSTLYPSGKTVFFQSVTALDQFTTSLGYSNYMCTIYTAGTSKQLDIIVFGFNAGVSVIHQHKRIDGGIGAAPNNKVFPKDSSDNYYINYKDSALNEVILKLNLLELVPGELTLNLLESVKLNKVGDTSIVSDITVDTVTDSIFCNSLRTNPNYPTISETIFSLKLDGTKDLVGQSCLEDAEKTTSDLTGAVFSSVEDIISLPYTPPASTITPVTNTLIGDYVDKCSYTTD
jgi:hypothetical protein